MLDTTTLSILLLLLAIATTLLLAAMLYPSALLRWFQRKRYQYEVTFSLYMLTSTEKFIFNSVLFLLLSLLIIAASLYLPEHLTIIAKRMSYYLSGNRDALAGSNTVPKVGGVDTGITPNGPLGAGAMGNEQGIMEL